MRTRLLMILLAFCLGGFAQQDTPKSNKKPYWCSGAKPVWPLAASNHRQPGEYEAAQADCRVWLQKKSVPKKGVADESVPDDYEIALDNAGPKYTCLTGASYTYPIWNPQWPYRTEPGPGRDEGKPTYKTYKPTTVEEAAAEKDCAANLQKYLNDLGHAEQRMIDDQDKNLKTKPISAADVRRIANCARQLCAAGMSLDKGQTYFDYRGTRYTLGAGPASLAIYVRVGTRLRWYLDLGTDGTIDEANDRAQPKRYFKSFGPKTFGLEWRGYHQREYNRALEEISKYIDSHPRVRRVPL